jgi:cell division transport system permease protein
MDWGRLRFFLAEVGHSFTRNTLMQLTAIGTVMVTIALLGTFLFAREAVGRIGDDVMRRIEISVFLDDKTTGDAAKAVAAKIETDTRVESVRYIPKADGLRAMRDRLRGQIDTSLLTSNPLPDALRVRVKHPEDVNAVAAAIQAQQGVGRVVYAQEEVTRLLRLGELFAKIGLGVAFALMAVAAILIANTIRLTVFARRREIAIMQLVGAENSYIRAPFILEGMLDGLIGAALALGALEIGRAWLLPKLASALPFVPFRVATINELSFALTLLSIGALVGVLASWFSVGRHLRT